jgi:hypothetical protein
MTKTNFLARLIALAIAFYVVRLTADSLRAAYNAFGAPGDALNSFSAQTP